MPMSHSSSVPAYRLILCSSRRMGQEVRSGPPIGIANGTTVYRPTEKLEAGKYRLVVTNTGPDEALIEYQVHQDFVVVANMTAKNVMALSLALSMGIVALFLYGRPRRP